MSPGEHLCKNQGAAQGETALFLPLHKRMISIPLTRCLLEKMEREGKKLEKGKERANPGFAGPEAYTM